MGQMVERIQVFKCSILTEQGLGLNHSFVFCLGFNETDDAVAVTAAATVAVADAVLLLL